MTMQSRAPAPAARPRAFGSLPAAKTAMTLERALELAGVDETELALLASTTFKEADSLEQLVTLIATTRRRGLDGLTRQVYFERFGGSNQPASFHVGIDGLRAIAANTNRFGGKLEPRFSGQWHMPLDGGATKVVPEKCTVTVYAIVQGQKCAFEGVAWMEESYPGTSGRGRTWRERPRGMLSVAAERQALRTAFPSETSGVVDADDGEQGQEDVNPIQPRRVVEAGETSRLAQQYQRMATEFYPDEEVAPREGSREPARIEVHGAVLHEEVGNQSSINPQSTDTEWTANPKGVLAEVHTRIRTSADGGKTAPVAFVKAVNDNIRGPLEGDDDAAREALIMLAGVESLRELDKARCDAILTVASDLGPSAWADMVRQLPAAARGE